MNVFISNIINTIICLKDKVIRSKSFKIVNFPRVLVKDASTVKILLNLLYENLSHKKLKSDNYLTIYFILNLSWTAIIFSIFWIYR